MTFSVLLGRLERMRADLQRIVDACLLSSIDEEPRVVTVGDDGVVG